MNKAVNDYSRLTKRIYDIFGSIPNFAAALKIEYVHVLEVLCSASYLEENEISTWAKALNIAEEEFTTFFFPAGEQQK